MMTLGIIVLCLLFLLGAPVFAVMVGFAFLGAVATARGDIMLEFAGELTSIASLGTGEPAQILSTIPLFILAGYLMAESKTASRLVRFAQAALGWLPGGLAVVTIFACALFTTFTGASGVTIVALGGLLVPSLLKEGYPERFSLGLIAGTGSVGLLFPPALPLFVYGTVYGVNDQLTGGGSGFSTDRFLFAGIMPGLVLLFILSAIAIAVAIRHKVPRHGFDVKECGRSLVVALPELLLPFFIIGALATGTNIPEIASVTVVYVLLIEVVLYRDLALGSLGRIIRESMALVGAIFIIIFAASALTSYFVTDEIPIKLVDWISDHMDSRWTFLLALNVFLIMVGMMMDIFSAIVIVVPLITPLAKQYGIDPFHLGVIFLLNLEIGYLTPPVGLNLFITSFKFQRPVVEVIRATIPFLLAMVVALGLITYIPALTLVQAPKKDLITQVTLPDGTVKQHSTCKQELSQMQCNELFEAITFCRKQADEQAAIECEQNAITDYVEATQDDLDGDDDDDDDDDFDEDDLEDDFDEDELDDDNLEDNLGTGADPQQPDGGVHEDANSSDANTSAAATGSTP